MAAANSGASKLYVVSAKGKVFALKSSNDLEEVVSAIDMKRLAFAHQSRDVLYGIASDLKVYVWVSEPEVPIRQVVELYQNERWTPTRGYSDLLLPTDRHHWSDERGKLLRPKEDVDVPSPDWTWEGTDWQIDENFQGQLLGPEGWTYAVDFPSTYSPEKRWNSMVRRRRFIRTCRYRSTNRWAQMPSFVPTEKELAFTDIAAGGCDVNYPDGQIHLSVWAVSIQGLVFFRPGCVRAVAYHGLCWMRVDLPEDVEVTQISCGPTERVWAVTSTGWALVRLDISRDCHYGSRWATVEPPAGCLLVHISVGADSVWAVGKNGSIWFRQGMKKNSADGSGWVSISEFTATCLTISRNGEVFALGESDKELYWRSGVSLEDPHGKAWKKIPMRGRSVPDSSNGDMTDPYIWISATAGFLDTHSALWEDTEGWKSEVMKELAGRFSREMKAFSTLERAVSRSGWKNSSVLKVWSAKLSTWEECLIEVDSGQHDAVSKGHLTIEGQNFHVSLFLSDLTAVQLHEDPQGTQELWIYTTFLTRAATPLRMSGSRCEMERCYIFLTECHWNELAVKDLPKIDRLWILAPLTGCPSVSHAERPNILPAAKWLTLAGHFQTIESASGITWALGHDHSIWIWTGCYPGKAGTERRVQTDTHTVTLYENQRWNPVGGFSSALLPSDRYGWSDKSGQISLTKETFQLPSESWRWDGDWLVDYSRSDEDGWRYSFDFPGGYHAQKSASDYVRRRRWYRVMKVESAAPWVPGPAIKLKSISICPGVKAGDIIPLWGVTVDGSVVLRDRVTTNSPQGDAWISVRNPIPFLQISVGQFCVWATASDGTAYVRNGTKNKMDGLYWFQVEKPDVDVKLVEVTVGGGVVWALGNGSQLYFRKNFSAAFPEGTEWLDVQTGDLLRISANLQDDLYAIMTSPNREALPVVARRTGLRHDDKIGSGWEYGIYASHVSGRGLLS